MIQETNLPTVKEQAKALHTTLKNFFPEAKLGQAQEILAHQAGFKTFAAYRKNLSAEKPDWFEGDPDEVLKDVLSQSASVVSEVLGLEGPGNDSPFHMFSNSDGNLAAIAYQLAGMEKPRLLHFTKNSLKSGDEDAGFDGYDEALVTEEMLCNMIAADIVHSAATNPSLRGITAEADNNFRLPNIDCQECEPEAKSQIPELTITYHDYHGETIGVCKGLGFSARLGKDEEDQMSSYQNAALDVHDGTDGEKVVSVAVFPKIPKEVIDKGDLSIAEHLYKLFFPLLEVDKIKFDCEIGDPR